MDAALMMSIRGLKSNRERKEESDAECLREEYSSNGLKQERKYICISVKLQLRINNCSIVLSQ